MGLSMDCFAITISNSSISGKVEPGIPLKLTLAFTLSHLLLLFLGHRLGGTLQPMFEGHGQWMAFAVLTIVGVKMIMEWRKRDPRSKAFDINRAAVILILSLATAVDAFLSGIALGIAGMRLGPVAGMLLILVFVFSLGGMVAGRQLGLKFARSMAVLGGIFLVMAAAMILMRIL